MRTHYCGELSAALVERTVAHDALNWPDARRLLTVPGVNVICAASFLAAIGDIRGRGAMIAVEIVGADGHIPDAVRAGSVSSYCHSQGVLTLTCGTYGNVLRFLPPLVSPDALLTEAFEVVAAAFDATA
jgi:4-aminobutyrate aminotransferase/(S)-3-amino-2-methylpropionate transaminase